MTHKFAITLKGNQLDIDKPVLYKIIFNNGFYYLHKGKNLEQSYSKLLYDVFRATIKDVTISDDYVNIVSYCKKYPQVNKVTIEVLLNAAPELILKKEKQLWSKAKKDSTCLNRSDKLPYTPEWMIRHKYLKRCEKCVSNGIVDGIKERFVFCPRCGKSI